MVETTPLIIAAAVPLWVYQHLPVAVFVFTLGAIVGSFVNVVIYRLPIGMSVITPPSRCPTCGAKLSWIENFPILGWVLVRGRCRRCRVRISPQYVVIELIMALVFLGLYVVLYMVGPSTPWWGEIGGPWWYSNGIFRTAPVFLAHALLLAGIVAMVVIDARTFTIPIQIPVAITVIAFVAYPLEALLPLRSTPLQPWPIPVHGWQVFTVSGGGMAGLIVSMLLLRTGVIRYSFADYQEYVQEDETLADYPHARREMGVELLYLLPCVAGLVGGFFLGRLLPGGAAPAFVEALGGTLLGYLAGGGLVWGVRIAATLVLGREAMGIGDVHMLAAVGAVLGWLDPIFVFFIAPFSGLLWVAVSKGLVTLFRKGRRELPYGPHLAAATVVVIACRSAINWLLGMLMGGWSAP